MTRQVTDQLYIDLEYFTPEEYYTYIAEASASISAEFTQSAQGFRTVEIVLSAFSDASVSAQVEVTKSTTVSVSSAFSLEASASGFENAEAALTSTATMSCVATKIVTGLADISAAFTQITVGDRFVNATVALESSVTMATVATRSVTFGSGLSSNADCACVNYRVRDFDSAVGALFNTAVQAVATVNSFAVLDSVSTLTADVTRQVGASSAALSSAFTVNANALSFTNAAANLSSEFIINIDALSFSNGQAALTSTFTQTAVPEYIFLYRDALRIAYSGTYARISTTQKKFGTYSLKADDVGITDFPVEKITNPVGGLDIYDFDANDWTIEFFYWDNEDTSSGEVFERIFALKNSSGTSKLDFYKETSVATNNNRYQLESNDWTNTAPLDPGSYAISTWRHFAFTYVASTKGLSFYVDGTRIGTRTFTSGWTNMSRFSLGGPSFAISNAYIDELRISDQVRYTGTSFTVPTTQFDKNRKDVALFRFEEETLSGSLYYSNSETILQEAEATLSSAFTQTTAVSRNRTAASSLSSSFAVTAVIGSIEEISSSMFDDVELSATASVTRTAATSVSSEFTQTVTAIRIQRAASDLSTEFTQVADVLRTRTAASALASQFTLTADVDLVADINSSLGAVFTQSATGDRTRSTAVSLTTAFALDTANQRVRYAESAQSSAFTQTADVQRVQQAASDLSAAFTQTTSIDRFRTASLNAASQFTQTTAVDRIRYGLADFNTAFTQVTDAVRIQQGSADISAAFEQTTTAARTRNLVSAQSAIASITTNAVKTVDAVIATEAIATQLTAAAKIGDFLIDCAVTSSVSCAGSRVRFFETLSDPRGVNLQDDVTGTDLGPFLLLDNVPTTSVVNRSLISFWTNEGTEGAILNTDGVYDGNPSGTNILTIAKEGSDYFLYYYGNRAEAGIFPYVKWVIDYANQDLLHNFLIYIDTGGFPTQTTTESYRFFLDGVEQTQLAVTDAYVEPKKSHPFTIKDGLLLGYGSRFFASGVNSGYTPYANLENTAPNSAVLAQFWMDNNTSYDISDQSLRNKFYNADWTDLGTDGTATGLARPDYYVRLNGYQDLDEQGTVSAANNNWSWKYFNNRDDGGFYDITEFTATPDQDNPYVTQIVARLTASATVAALFAANLQSSSALSATVVRIQANGAALSSAFTQTTNITVNIGTITTISSQSALVINAGYLLQATSTQSSQFSLTAVVGAIGDNNISMFSAFAVTADAAVIPPIRTEANLSSTSTLTAQAGFREQSSAALSSVFTATADVTVIPPVRIEANLSSNFTVTASIQGQFNSQAQLISQFTQTTSGGRIRRPGASLQAQATLIANNNKLVGGLANLPAVATQLTVGSAISIDQFYQYKVESETRRGTVLPENRVFQVESETRVNMIL